MFFRSNRSQQQRKPQYQIGQKVFFKKDVEGTGYIIDITVNGTYVLATSVDPESRSWEQWHPAAKVEIEYKGAVVFASDYDVRDLA